MLKQVLAVFVSFLLPFMAFAATCPENYSEFTIDSNHLVIPSSEQCPDGMVELYTVSDCSDADVGDVCAVCDSGYTLAGGKQCLQLCSAQNQKIHFGSDLSFNLLKDRGTIPALNIQTENNQICYVGLASGRGGGLNFLLPDGRQYHAVKNTGGYRVCATGYTLSYSCGDVGGVPPRSYKLKSGYWYTVPANAGGCNVPSNMRFAGWYADGVQVKPYMIHTYNFNSDKTLVARFADVSKYNINYYCLPSDTVPVYVDTVIAYESTDVKTNMCAFDAENLDTLAWVKTIPQAEMDSYIDYLVKNGSDISDVEYLYDIYVNGSYVLSDVTEALAMVVFPALHINCIKDADFQASNAENCAIAKLFYDHTYFVRNNDFISDDEEYMFKQITPVSDVDLRPLYIPKKHDVNWDCGDGLFRASAGEMNFNSDARYNWNVLYYCTYNGLNTWIGESGNCIDAAGNNICSGKEGIHFEGWEIDGEFVGKEFVYKYTEDKTATGIYSYDLHAEFDCGSDGVLTSGESMVSYSYNGKWKSDIPLNINAMCTPNEGKKFLGWKLNYDTDNVVYNVGDTLNWLDVFLDTENKNSSYGFYNRVMLTAVYEDVSEEILYYCKYDAATDNPDEIQLLYYGTEVEPLEPFCPVYRTGTIPAMWYTRFTDEEIAELNAITPYEELEQDIKNMVAPFFGKTDTVEGMNAYGFIFGLSAGKNNDDYVQALYSLIEKHLYLSDNDSIGNKSISEPLSLYSLYLYNLYQPNFNYGSVPMFSPEGGFAAAFVFPMYWPYYGAEFQPSLVQNPTCNEGISIAGYVLDGTEYGADDKIKWVWESDKTLDVLFNVKLAASFNCGMGGKLQDSTTGAKSYQPVSPVYGDDVTFEIDAKCVPDDINTRFAGWKLGTYRNGDLFYQVGDMVSWYEIANKTNPNYIENDFPFDNCEAGISSGIYEFKPVYEQVADGIKYYRAYNAPANDYYANQEFDDAPVNPLPYIENVDRAKGVDQFAWYTRFTDEEIAELNAITPYEELDENIKNMVAPFFGKTDTVEGMSHLTFAFTLMIGGTTYNDKAFSMIKQHIFTYNEEKDTWSQQLTDLTPVYALYGYIADGVEYDSGNIITYSRGVDGIFDFVEWPYYGMEYNLDNFAPSTCNTGIVHVGYEYNGDVYDRGETIVWPYTEKVVFNMLFDIDIGITFDCGTGGALAEGSVASKSYKSDKPETGNIDPNMKLDSVCVPNDDSHVFVGWEPADIYSNGTYYYGSDFDLLGWLHQSNPHAGAMDDVSQCPKGIRSGFVNFNAVYADK